MIAQQQGSVVQGSIVERTVLDNGASLAQTVCQKKDTNNYRNMGVHVSLMDSKLLVMF